jgi:hypothetical protein
MAGEWQQLPLSLTMQGFKSPDKRLALTEQQEGDTRPDEDEDSKDNEVSKSLGGFRELVGKDRFDKLVGEYMESHGADADAAEAILGLDGDE